MDRKSLTANARLRYSQVSPKHDPRFFFTFMFYALYCNGFSVFRTRTDPRTGHVGGSNTFSTRSMPFFTKFYELFYVVPSSAGQGVKTIPANIAVYITPISLAF